MDIYIASRLTDSEKAKKISDELELNGHHIVFKWWEITEELDEEQKKQIALGEYDAVQSCEAIVFIPPGYKGSHFELGVAYERNKKIFALKDVEGWKESIFHYLPNFHEVTEEELYEVLK